jgi:serine/threonine protein kinase
MQRAISGSGSSACLGEETILALVDGRQALAASRTIEEHVEGCADCRELLARAAEEILPSVTRSGSTGLPRQTPQPGERVGRYQICSIVGMGAMGVVYAAYDPELDRKIALKILRSREGGDPVLEGLRLKREAQALARLSHPGVVAVYDVGLCDDSVFIAMELVDGTTLREWLRQEGRSRREILDALLAAGRGLEAAHRAGLVHRDFKPENVLIGNDGRVRVSDFGLARPLGESELSTQSRPQLAGTPAYMPPEQLRGDELDERADQFSFCVTVWEALFDERPFAGDSLRALAETIEDQRPKRRLGARVQVSVRCLRALRRGLAASADDRFPEMGALLERLAEEGRPKKMRWALLALGITIAASAGAYRQARRAALCVGADGKLAGVWDGARRERVHRRLLASGQSYAAASFEEVARLFDDYSARWVAMRTEACQATRLSGEQSEELMDLRMGCLDDRLHELGTLTSLLADSEGLLDRAPRAAAQLSELAVCANRRALESPLKLPADLETQKNVAEVRAQLAEVRAFHAAGRYEEGLSRARAAAQRAETLHYRPLEAEALYWRGNLEAERDQQSSAADTLRQAALAAEAGRHDESAAESWTLLSMVQGDDLQHYDDAQRSAELAAAALERLGGQPRIEAELANAVGATAFRRSKLGEARAAFDRGLKICERAPECRTAGLLNNLGSVADQEGDYVAAESYYRRSLELRERTLGRDHPDVVPVLLNLGDLAIEQGQNDLAIERFKRADAIVERAHGREHVEAAAVLSRIADVEMRAGHFDRARAAYQRALTIREHSQGPNHVDVAVVLDELGRLCGEEGKLAESVPLFERALHIREAGLRANHPNIALSLLGLAEAQRGLHRINEAVANFRRALAILQSELGAKNPKTIFALSLTGNALLDAHQPSQALPLLEQAMAARADGPGDPIGLADLQASLGEALWETGGDHTRAARLMRQARATYSTSGATTKAELAELDLFMKRRSIARTH